MRINLVLAFSFRFLYHARKMMINQHPRILRAVLDNYSIDPDLNKIKKARFSTQGIAGLLDKYDIEIE
jgi:hypothetical protein